MTPSERQACYQIGLAYGEAARSVTGILRGEPLDRPACMAALEASFQLRELPLQVPGGSMAPQLGAVVTAPDSCPPGLIHDLAERLHDASLFLWRALLHPSYPQAVRPG